MSGDDDLREPDQLAGVPLPETRTAVVGHEAARAKVLAALDAYDQSFPHGRYSPDIRLYRADVAARQHEWKTVLDLTLAQLDGHENPALNTETAEELGDVFASLADERYRQDILAAIKENKRAKEMLEKYLAVESDQNPLIYMKAWLREQLAAK